VIERNFTFLSKMETDRLNTNTNMPISRSFLEKMNEAVTRSPGTAMAWICVLFIVIVLSLTLPLYFPFHKQSTN